MAEDIIITLDGEEMTLRPTLRAARVVSNTFSGFATAAERVRGVDLMAISVIVAAGLGKLKSDEVDEVERKVFRTGTTTFVEPLAKFLERLMYGGKSSPAPEAD